MVNRILATTFAVGCCSLACGEAWSGDGPGTGASPTGGVVGSSGSGGSGPSAGISNGGAAGGSSSAGSPGVAGGSGSGGVDTAKGFAQLEDLNRGVVAVPSEKGVLVSWRLFGYEPADLGFNVYRDGTKLNESPI